MKIMNDIRNKLKMIKIPHLDSFNRFIHLDSIERGIKYAGFDDDGLKRILSRIFPLKINIGGGRRYQIDIQDYDLTDEVFRLKDKFTDGIAVNLTLLKKEYCIDGSIIEHKKERFCLCILPKLNNMGYFSFKTDNGGKMLKCPVGQIIRSPGIFFEINKDGVFCTIRPSYGRKLMIAYGKYKRGGDDKTFYLVSLSQKSERLYLNRFLDYLENPDSEEYEDVKEFLHTYIDPKNPLLYDLSTLGRKNINQRLGTNSMSGLLEIDDILLGFSMVLKASYSDISVEGWSYPEKQLDSVNEKISKMNLSSIGINQSYINNFNNAKLDCVEDIERAKLVVTILQVVKKLGNVKEDALHNQIDKLLAENAFYRLKRQLSAKKHKISLNCKEDDPYHIKNKRVKLLGDYLERIFRSHFNKVLHYLPLDEWKIAENYSRKINGYLKLNSLQDRINRYLSQSSMVQVVNQCNPLSDISSRRKLTFHGDNAGKGMKGAVGLRDIHYSMHSRICPFETPQGPNTGLNLSLAMYADINKFGEIITPHRAKTSTGIKYHAGDEDDCNTISPEKGSREARKGEEEIIYPNEKEINFYDISPNQMLGLGASLIPFLGHNDGPRAMMGISMMKQALPLKHPELPYIKTGNEEIIARVSGWPVYARSKGTVNKVTSNYIKIGREIYPLSIYMPTSQKTIFHHTPVVKKGNKVAEKQLLADSSCTVNGELALGTNMLTAFMFYKGYNYEDAVVISESASRKLTSLHVLEITCDVRIDEKITKTIDGKGVDYLNEKGIVKEGTIITPGMVLVGKARRIDKRDVSDTMEKLFDEILRIFGANPEYMDTSFLAAKGIYGKVLETNIQNVLKGEHLLRKDASNYSKQRITIKILAEKTAKVGDKLANRHGNKGVISKILPDDEMPHMPDGTPVEVILNPLGVYNRMNIGQLLELHLSWEAKNSKDGALTFSQFMEDVALEELMKNGFKHSGLDNHGRAKLRDGKSGKEFMSPVSAGYIYTLKLNHLSEDKISARSTDLYSRFLQQPFQGKKTFGDRTIYGGQRVGEMEVWALEAYHVAETLRELLSLKSDDITGRAILQKKVGNKDYSSCPTFIPYSFKQMVSLLRGLCINIVDVSPDNKKTDMLTDRLINVNTLKELDESLMTNEDILNLSSGRIGARNGLISERDLFRESIFGFDYDFRCKCGFYKNRSWENKDRCPKCSSHVAKRKDFFNFKMGHIELPILIPNPLYPGFVNAFLGMDVKSFSDKCIKRSVSPETEIRDKIKEIDNQISIYEKELSENKNRNDIKVKLKSLQLIKNNKCLFIKYLPVIPVNCRFRFGTIENVLNKSYIKVIRACNRLRLMQSHEVPEIILADEFFKFYRVINKHFTTLIDELKGKEGLIRRDLLGKRVDFSGRIVVVPAPELKMNHCELPAEFISELFKPQIIKELVEKKKINLPAEYDSYVRTNLRSDNFNNLLIGIIRDKVILLNRFPTLHRMNIQAFYPLPGKDSNVMKIPTTICSAFNADFDGDQFSVHLPVSDAAQKEAKDTCLPSQNIISPASGLLTPVSLDKDIIAGLYWLTMDKRTRSKGEKFNSIEDALEYAGKNPGKLWNKISFKQKNGGEIHTTPGRVIFNTECKIDEENYLNEEINKKTLEKFLLNYVKRFGTLKVIDVIENIKTIGFKYATISGITIDYLDLPVLKDISISPDNLDLEKIEKRLFTQLRNNKSRSVSIIFLSGAGKKSSLVQTCGARGYMARPDGSKVPYPILSNFRNGLSPLEYFVSGHGARKGGVDKALSTTKSGYLMRKIVECVHPIRIGRKSCIRGKGVLKKALKDEKGNVLLPLADRIILRYSAETIKDKDSKLIVRRGSLINDNVALKITGSGLEQVRIMSPVTCECDDNKICYKCYGNLFSTNKPAYEGMAAGIIAAQSIGEPCTQLAMRVFHRGGISEDDITSGFFKIVNILEARDKELAATRETEGDDALYLYMLDEIQRLFVAEGVIVDDRHIEVVLKELVKDGELSSLKKAALKRDGFLSKISFENLKKMLVVTSIEDTKESFTGLKENILLAKSI